MTSSQRRFPIGRRIATTIAAGVTVGMLTEKVSFGISTGASVVLGLAALARERPAVAAEYAPHVYRPIPAAEAPMISPGGIPGLMADVSHLHGRFSRGGACRG